MISQSRHDCAALVPLGEHAGRQLYFHDDGVRCYVYHLAVEDGVQIRNVMNVFDVRKKGDAFHAEALDRAINKWLVVES